jgi:hypothetical protein
MLAALGCRPRQEEPMKLDRYNQILFALLGTGLAAGISALTVWSTFYSGPGEPARILVDEKSGARPRPSQELVYCSPYVVGETGLQLLPVSARTAESSNELRISSPIPGAAFLGQKSRYYGREGCEGQVFNIVVRDPHSGSQRLLFDRPIQLDSLQVPGERCGEKEGTMPCDMIHWLVRDTDTNGDGAISAEDTLVAFLSSLAVEELRPVTPREATVVDHRWSTTQKSILYRVQFDRNKDRLFDDEDPTELVEYRLGSAEPAGEVVNARIQQALQSQVR